MQMPNAFFLDFLSVAVLYAPQQRLYVPMTLKKKKACAPGPGNRGSSYPPTLCNRWNVFEKDDIYSRDKKINKGQGDQGNT